MADIVVKAPDVSRTPVVIFVSKSVAVPADATLLMTIHIGGTLYTVGIAAWPVPGNKTFRVN